MRNIFYKDETGGLAERSQIEKKYLWDTSLLFSSNEEFDKVFTGCTHMAKDYAKYEGKLAEDVQNTLNCLELDEAIGASLEKLHLYTMLEKDSDLRDNTAQTRYEKVKTLYAGISAQSSFIRPELIAIDEKTIRTWLTENEKLKKYEHFFNDLLRTKKHTLDAKEEKLLARTSEVTGAGYDAFSILTNSDIDFPETTDEQGKTVQMSHGRYYSALYSKDRSYRQRGYNAYLTPYKRFANTFSVLLNNALKRDSFYAKTRNYDDSLSAALSKNAIPGEVYTNLLESVNKGLDPMHGWIKRKAEIIGVEKIQPYDMYVSLFEEKEAEKYSFDEAYEIILEAFKPMGNNYTEAVKEIYKERRIDVYETTGKRSGAYSSGAAFGFKPYILMNWNGLLNDVFTLAHEIGHNVHSLYAGSTQPYIYADYTIFLAEIASTFNEALLFDFLIKNADTAGKKQLLEKYLNDITATFYRQTMFAEFEYETHKRVDEGEFLSAEVLCELYSDVYKKYTGPGMDMGDEERYAWSRIPHFYYNFYVYQYATGFAASAELHRLLQNDPGKLIPAYENFLRSGSSDYSLPILQKAGVNLLEPGPVLAVARRMEEILKQLDTLV